MSVEEASAGAGMAASRLRRLERGAASLEYLEGIRLAKALDLCPNCFRRLFEAATDREERESAVAAGPADDPAADTPADAA